MTRDEDYEDEINESNNLSYQIYKLRELAEQSKNDKTCIESVLYGLTKVLKEKRNLENELASGSKETPLEEKNENVFNKYLGDLHVKNIKEKLMEELKIKSNTIVSLEKALKQRDIRLLEDDNTIKDLRKKLQSSTMKMMDKEKEMQSLREENNRQNKRINFMACFLTRLKDQVSEHQEWLSDDTIETEFTALQGQVKEKHLVLLVGPAVTQLIKITSADDLDKILKPLQFQKHSYVLFALNNNHNYKSGGSHWSLMVYSKAERMFYHFDSIRLMNRPAANQLCSNMRISCTSLKEVNCLQQDNGHDCGFHVLANARNIVEQVEAGNTLDSLQMLSKVDVLIEKFSILRKKQDFNILKEEYPDNTNECTKKLKAVPAKRDLKKYSNETPYRRARKNVTIGDICSVNESDDLRVSNDKSRVLIILDEFWKPLEGRTSFPLISELEVNWKVIREECGIINYKEYISDQACYYTRRDFVFIMGGFGDSGTTMSIYKRALNELIKITFNTNLLICTVPYRFENRFDTGTAMKNLLLRNIAYIHDHIKIINGDQILCLYQDYNGKSITESGKTKILNEIVNSVMLNYCQR